MSQLQLLLRRFDCFMLMGWDRGIPLDAAAVDCEKFIFSIASAKKSKKVLLWVEIEAVKSFVGLV